MQILDLDFTKADVYLTSLAYMRQQITILADKTTIFELRVLLPVKYGGSQDRDRRTVCLFLQTQNLYIIGFRGGQGRVFVTAGEKDNYDEKLAQAGIPIEQISKLRFDGSHGALGTYDPRPFQIHELAECDYLAGYSGQGRDELVKRPLSLLVCMISEASRFLEVQQQFGGVQKAEGRYVAGANGFYAGEPIQINRTTVTNWDAASWVQKLCSDLQVGFNEGKQIAASLRACAIEANSAICSALKIPTLPVKNAEVLAWLLGRSADPRLDGLRSDDKLKQIAAVAVRYDAKLRPGNPRRPDAEDLRQFLSAFSDDQVVKLGSNVLLSSIPEVRLPGAAAAKGGK